MDYHSTYLPWGESLWIHCYSQSKNFNCVHWYFQQITKQQVDKFVPGRQVPSCQLHVEWNGQQKQPAQLAHRVELIGARNPFNFFLISLPAVQPPPSQGNGLFAQDLIIDAEVCLDFHRVAVMNTSAVVTLMHIFLSQICLNLPSKCLCPSLQEVGLFN